MISTYCKLCKIKAQSIKEINEPIYFHCPNCDLIFMDDASILNGNEEKRRYSLHRNNRENKGYVSMFEQFIDVGVKPFKNGLKNGLDFGCGPGPVLSELLTELGIDMDIYDPYFYTIWTLKQKNMT